MEKEKCLRCNYEWYRRNPKSPDRCAKCNSPYWNKQRQRKRKPVELGKKEVSPGIYTLTLTGEEMALLCDMIAFSERPVTDEERAIQFNLFNMAYLPQAAEGV